MRGRQYILLAVMIVICCYLLSCSNNIDNTTESDEATELIKPPIEYISPEEYSVYTDLIEAMDAIDTKKKSIPFIPSEYKLLVIEDHTPDHVETINLQYVDSKMPGIDPETLTDFRARNQIEYPLERRFGFKIDYVFISNEEMAALHSHGEQDAFWDNFYDRYPESQGILSLSRVGFNNRMDQALVSIGNQSDWLSGSGFFILLIRLNGTWTIRDMVLTWIS
ncbi:hypothetical protein JW766_02245 [Candidatus Dojkabacteria bacterium]|nr:hypothetical protein [Candidatus Dojkabacteria bacterium]